MFSGLGKFMSESLAGRVPVFFTLSGSRAYGTDIEGSDVDIRGVVLRTKEEILTGRDFGSIACSHSDIVVYSLDKYLNMLSKGNSSAVEMLGTLSEHRTMVSKPGEVLLANAPRFFSMACVGSLAGHAAAQAKRSGAGKNKFKCLMHAVRLYGMAIDMLKGYGIQTYRKEDRGMLLAVRNGAYTEAQCLRVISGLARTVEELKALSILPESPDAAWITGFQCEVNESIVIGRPFGH